MTNQRAGDTEESRGSQILVGAGITFTVAVVVVTFLMCWRFVPGLVGESLGTIAGVMSTPFFMEASFAILGLVIVLGLNIWRRKKAGDEFVTMEVEDVVPQSREDAKPPGSI